MSPRPFNVRFVARAFHRIAFVSLPQLHSPSMLTTKSAIHVSSKQFSTIRTAPVHFHVSSATMRDMEAARTKIPELPKVELPNHRLMCRAFHRLPISRSPDCAYWDDCAAILR